MCLISLNVVDSSLLPYNKSNTFCFLQVKVPHNNDEKCQSNNRSHTRQMKIIISLRSIRLIEID